MVKCRPPSPELLEKIRQATPPLRLPRGYFDPLVAPTRTLLDRGLRLFQAADFLIREGALRRQHRQHFMDAMHGRISRLNRQRRAAGPSWAWGASPYFDSTHLVQIDQPQALCGSRATIWEAERSESSRCCRCLGIARKHGIIRI